MSAGEVVTLTCPVCGSEATGRAVETPQGVTVSAEDMARMALGLHQTFSGHAG